MSNTFRLMTSNVLEDGADPGAFGRLIDDVSPDVLVVQELGPSIEAVVASRFESHSMRPAEGALGHGIATQFEARFSEIEMPFRTADVACVDFDGGDVWVVGTHLTNPLNWPMWRSVELRRRQLDALDSWLSLRLEAAVVVAGDFNASPAWPAYRRMRRAMGDLAVDLNPAPTWGWRPGWPKILRIDHVFGRGVTADAVLVHSIDGSDHRAVVADIRRDENRSS